MQSALYSVSEAVGYEVDGVFYMSADGPITSDGMLFVLVMDTTFKTNRFHWPLLLVCGVNEQFQSILFAVALLHHQTTEAFTWALGLMRGAVTEEAWGKVACVMTDGDAGMAAAITETLPSAQHLRCQYHLEQNLRSNLVDILGLIPMGEFITQWKATIRREEMEDFLTAKAALHRAYPAAVPYLMECHWINEQRFAECFVKHFTTLGIRSTSRVEGWNSKLKGMLQVRSTTPLSVLFSSLQYASMDVDRRALAQSLHHAAQSKPAPNTATFTQEVAPWLTVFASEKARLQFDLQHNYQCQQQDVANRESAWYVWDRRDMQGITETRRVVHVTNSFMQCSCCFPITHLLPCRHVFALNLHKFKRAFLRGQVGLRWLKAYMPPPEAPASLAQERNATIPTAIPSYEPSSCTSAAEMPSRAARYGQLMGFCTTVCTRAAEYKEIFHLVLKWVMVLANWVEASTQCHWVCHCPFIFIILFLQPPTVPCITNGRGWYASLSECGSADTPCS